MSRANKTTNTHHVSRIIFHANFTVLSLQSKRDFMERPEPHALGNTLTQSISKINACSQHPTNKPSSKISSKRNDLANYLSKILDQQQKLQLNTFDQAQLHALYNPQTSNIDCGKNARSTKGTSSSKGFSK